MYSSLSFLTCGVEDEQSVYTLMCGHIDMYSCLHTYHIFIHIFFVDVSCGGWAALLYTLMCGNTDIYSYVYIYHIYMHFFF